ncbi:hypothetical protein D3C71_1500020 [compost metagenome]
MVSSSCRTSRKPLRTDWRCRDTGTRIRGARCAFSAPGVSVQRSMPMARYSVLAPPSSRPVRAAPKMVSRLASSASWATRAISSLLDSASSAMSSSGARPPRPMWTSAMRGSLPSISAAGKGRMRNSLPSTMASSSRPRSGTTSGSVDLVILKFSRRLRSVRSRRRDFHLARRPSGVSSAGSRLMTNSGSSGGNSGVGSMAAGCSAGSVSPGVTDTTRDGSGLICSSRARWMSMA